MCCLLISAEGANTLLCRLC
uniref:Uncharacterized protein n=1 Tax=Rhizophora mucronata TaxID=61149 RepID=A0A2P2Q493_RHIMU